MHLETKGEGTQISRDPQKPVPEKRDSKAEKHTKDCEGHIEAGTLTDLNAVL